MIRFYRLGLGVLAGRMILLLTTTGRKTGLPRTTPLQYEKDGSDYVVGSARGLKSDWVRNLQADPDVFIEIGKRKIPCKAEVITDPDWIGDFLELRLKRHPLMVRAILHSDGLPFKPRRADLLAYASRLAMVILKPEL